MIASDAEVVKGRERPKAVRRKRVLCWPAVPFAGPAGCEPGGEPGDSWGTGSARL